MNPEEYLEATEIIDWQHSSILELAKKIAKENKTEIAIARASFEWVRDNIQHSSDYQRNPVTCRASDVLKHRTGYCFAKSHLLAALLRANGIPAGFCYQRLSVRDDGEPYSLHGYNAIYLTDFGWYRVDARGNREGINAQFVPPKEQLAYQIKLLGEADFQNILAQPLRVVIQALQSYHTWNSLFNNLPDVPLDSLEKYDLVLGNYKK
jgi:transglutaminase-like putative cysteine protease